MKIDKKLIKELVDNLKEFSLTELEYQDGSTKIKVSRGSKISEQTKGSAIVSPNKTVLKSTDDSDGIRVKSPIIGTAYLAAEPGAKKFIEVGDKIKKGDTLFTIYACFKSDFEFSIQFSDENNAYDIGGNPPLTDDNYFI